METDSSLLGSEFTQSQEEELYQQLLLQTMGKMQNSGASDSKTIRPQPGLCAKTVTLPEQQKVFLNICQSPQVPLPPPLSHEDLIELLESDDPSGYRVPMSLGEPHTELDNSKQACTVYDVVVNDEFFQKCQVYRQFSRPCGLVFALTYTINCEILYKENDELFQQFLLAVSLEGLENKYNVGLSREWKVLKNRKFLGSITEQNIRTKSKPVIQELDSNPELCLQVEPAVGDPQYLIAEVHLPGVTSARSLVLDVGEDRLVLTARPSLFHLDCFLPHFVNQESSVAQYNTSTQILTVTMPVVG